MAKKKFKLRAKLVFRGEFQIKAHSKAEAIQKLKDSVGCTLGGIQTLPLGEEDIFWEFDNHGQVVLNTETGKEEGREQ